MMVLLSLMSGTTIKAQFNTVGCLYNHPANKTKNPQETNASPLVDNRLLFSYCFLIRCENRKMITD